MLVAGMAIALASSSTFAQKLELEKQDRICILGNTLADRIQHDGWLEAAIQARFPEHQLFIRNLGFSADQLTQRLRSMNFGTPDDHLTHNKANVIFLMFGFNESFQGQPGLAKFKEENNLSFPLLSDFNKEVSRAYHALYEDFVLGLKGVSKRAAFVLDAKGNIQYSEVLENAGNLPNFEEIENTLSNLK